MRRFTIALALLFAACRSDACQCEWPTIEVQVQRSSVVFAGIVTSLRMNGPDVVCTFERLELLKGVPAGASSIEVVTYLGGASCGFDFRLGRSYLVYAAVRDGALRTDVCQRTQLLFFPKDTPSDIPEMDRSGEIEADIVRTILRIDPKRVETSDFDTEIVLPAAEEWEARSRPQSSEPQTAQPGATDNPDDAQRLREDR